MPNLFTGFATSRMKFLIRELPPALSAERNHGVRLPAALHKNRQRMRFGSPPHRGDGAHAQRSVVDESLSAGGGYNQPAASGKHRKEGATWTQNRRQIWNAPRRMGFDPPFRVRAKKFSFGFLGFIRRRTAMPGVFPPETRPKTSPHTEVYRGPAAPVKRRGASLLKELFS